MITRKSEGNLVEKGICDLLQKRGWWCHRMVQGAAGQPCDIVALREGESLLIDAKAVQPDATRFPLSRIEPNQKSAFAFASLLGIRCGFAIWDGTPASSPLWLSWEMAKKLIKDGVASIRLEALEKLK